MLCSGAVACPGWCAGMRPPSERVWVPFWMCTAGCTACPAWPAPPPPPSAPPTRPTGAACPPPPAPALPHHLVVAPPPFPVHAYPHSYPRVSCRRRRRPPPALCPVAAAAAPAAASTCPPLTTRSTPAGISPPPRPHSKTGSGACVAGRCGDGGVAGTRAGWRRRWQRVLLLCVRVALGEAGRGSSPSLLLHWHCSSVGCAGHGGMRPHALGARGGAAEPRFLPVLRTRRWRAVHLRWGRASGRGGRLCLPILSMWLLLPHFTFPSALAPFAPPCR